MLTTNLAIVAPVTEADDRAARETVWQQVTERIVPQMGKLCTRFEPSGGAWGQKVSSPYSVILGRNEPALFLYFYASAKHQLDERAKAHLDGFLEHLEIGNEQTVGDTKMCTAYFKGDTAEARSHMERSTFPTVGRWYDGSSITNGAGSPANIFVFFKMIPEQMIAAIPTK